MFCYSFRQSFLYLTIREKTKPEILNKLQDCVSFSLNLKEYLNFLLIRSNLDYLEIIILLRRLWFLNEVY